MRSVQVDKSKEQRIWYFDYLRVMACILVIFIHTSADTALSGWWYYITTSFAFIAVPIFFMMSGYLILSSEKTADMAVLKKRILHLVVPLGTWTLITVLWLTWKEVGWSFQVFVMKMLSALEKPALNHFWFMYTIIAIYLISPILWGGVKMLSCSAKRYVMGLLFFVEVYAAVIVFVPQHIKDVIGIDVAMKLLIFDGHLCTFIIGFFLGNGLNRISNKFLVSSMIFLISIISVGTEYFSFINGALIQTLQDQSRGLEVFLAATVFLLFQRNFNKPGERIEAYLMPISALSMPVYLMHNILRNVMNEFGITAFNFWSTIGITIINFGVCFIVVKTLASIKCCSFLFTGITYKKACEECNWQYTMRRVKTNRINSIGDK